MTRCRIAVGLALLLGACSNRPTEEAVEIASELDQRVVLSQRAVFADYEPGQLIQGDVARSDGEKPPTMSGTKHLAWKEFGPEGCSKDCEVTEAFGPTPLTLEQATTLNQLVTGLPDEACGEDNSVVCDPGVMIRLVIDERATYYGDGCSLEICPGYHEAVQAAVDYVNQLAQQAL